jgi:hypothetical protein
MDDLPVAGAMLHEFRHSFAFARIADTGDRERGRVCGSRRAGGNLTPDAD